MSTGELCVVFVCMLGVMMSVCMCECVCVCVFFLNESDDCAIEW